MDVLALVNRLRFSLIEIDQRFSTFFGLQTKLSKKNSRITEPALTYGGGEEKDEKNRRLLRFVNK